MTAPILPLRSVLTLCAFALLLAASSAGFLLYGTGFFNTEQLPGILTGLALFFATLGAPFVFGEKKNQRESWARSALAAIWCGVATGFMLLVSARIAPIEINNVIHATIWITALAWISILLNAILPRSAPAILFAWIVIPPVSAYMLAEIFLTSPAGGSGLAESTAPQAAELRSTIHWLLSLSPGTATFGALFGTLVDGSDYSHLTGYLTMLFAALLTLTLGAFQRAEQPVTSDSRAIPSSAPQS